MNLNAKKLDINFDTDDFFNSFEPSKPNKKPETKPAEVKLSHSEEKPQESGKELRFGQKIENNNERPFSEIGAAFGRQIE